MNVADIRNCFVYMSAWWSVSVVAAIYNPFAEAFAKL